MSSNDEVPPSIAWARLRFAVVGPLLVAPAEHGVLQAEFERLAQKSWRHPTTGEVVRFGPSTIERWYYAAKNCPADPVAALARKLNAQVGTHPSVLLPLRQAIRAQYERYPRWSYQLHYDNLVVLAEKQPEIAPVPSYPTVRRFMKSQGLFKRKKPRHKKLGSQDTSVFEPREQLSFEAQYVSALWHLDFHEGSRRVLTAEGKRQTAYLLGILDDHSRLCLHLQWYLHESAETLVHGLIQAFLKRDLCNALLSDNGAAMTAAETRQGLFRLGIVQDFTLPAHPEQNAKQEVFWAQVEGRLMPMLEAEPELTLELLNRATQAWVEMEYNRKLHSEIGQAPVERFISSKNVSRPSPDAETLRHLFRRQERRTQRLSDGTLSVQGVRFELPPRYRALLRPHVRYASWDLSSIDLVDERADKILCALYPLDKQRNADRRRRVLGPVQDQEPSQERTGGIAPLLQKLMADYAATGLPPAYLCCEPQPEKPPENDDNDKQEDDQS
jgi:putative transposase